MKPSTTTDAQSIGPRSFELQIEGAESGEIMKLLKGSSLVAFATPANQSLSEAWLLRLVFDCKVSAEVSSVCESVKGWQEVGILKLVLLTGESFEHESANSIFVSTMIDGFVVDSIERLVFVDEDVSAECGIVIRSAENVEFIVAAGVSPGSVSASVPLVASKFNPEMDVLDCERRPM